MAATQAILEALTSLLGTWKGQGKGMFPTLEDFEYSETLQIRRDPGASFLTYQQDTELIDAQGNPSRKSHWEAGVLRPQENGSIELACVQGSGRVEVLQGKLLVKQSLPGTIGLQFESKLIGNDERVKAAIREWTLSGNQLKYVMKMSTSRVDELSLHLEANLFKR
jgi:hypothetical protein